MKLTVLGCWAPYPRAGGACSGYLLQDSGKNILIDCGNGVMGNLLKSLHFRELDAVILSHLHPDHHMDIFSLRHAVKGEIRTDPDHPKLPLFLPEGPPETFRQLARFCDAFDIRPIEKLASTSAGGFLRYLTMIGDIRVSLSKTNHPLPTYSVLLEGSKRFFYSADTRWVENLVGQASGADLAVCEASVIEQDKEYTKVGHLTARQAGELGAKAGAGKLVITHFWPEYDQEVIRREAEAGFGGPVIMAREGLIVQA